MITRTIFLLTVLTITLHIYCENPRRYITQNGSGLRDGSTWENAGGAEELEDIIDSIQDADFWIAKGTYKPSRYVYDPEDERDMTFLPNHNNIYGGFAGNETDLSQRDIKANETIFSGDIGIEGDNSDNCYHVMRAVPILDGVTICNGNANGMSDPNQFGGGVYVWGYDSVFRNCTFRDNYASWMGGAVFMDSWGYDVTFENCLFYNNGTNYGGGGAILCYRENTVITNCTFVKNKVNVSGIVSFTGNITGLKMTNNIFWQNTGNAIQYDNYYYSGYIFHNAIEGGYAGITNINLSSSNTGEANSPYFTDPDNHDYSLQSLSPCIDAGVYWNVSCETDITGSLRPQGTGWDIGAYEYNNGPLTTVLPVVSTLSPEYTTVSTARVRGNVTDDGGSKMISKGVYYSITPDFDPVDSTLIRYDQLYNEGEFHIDITNLPANTTYYYRIFCENRIGTAVGEEMSFTTDSGISPDANGILYAKPDGNGDGSSWANAIHGNDLQLGIDHADVTEVWLAAGKYVPTSWPRGGSNERGKHFSLKQNVILYGGFNGTETAVEQRDIKINKTVLSGDIGTEGEYYDNTFRVVSNGSRDIDHTAVIDGVTISDANGDGSYGSGKGGGMTNGNSCSPTIRNCTFENNRALYGGGIYNIDSFPTLINCAIVNNTALIAGGGLFNRNNYYFKENSAAHDRTIELYHCTVAGNSAPQGSQITFAQESWADDIYIKMYNSVVWGDELEIFWCDIDNAHFMEETQRPSGSYIAFCGLSSPETGEGNILLSRNNTGDPNSPYFTDPESGDYSLQYDSACKDMAIYRYATEEDILGTVRPQGAAYDIGAYEFETIEPNGTAPTVETIDAHSITASTALCSTNILSDGGASVMEYGVKVSNQAGFNPESNGFLYTISGEYSEGSYSVTVTGLLPSTTYYYRSYASNRMGYSYGQQESFTTASILPDINKVVYVKTDGTGNGSSWENALSGADIQAAIDHPESKQIWMAKGTYKPNSWPRGGFLSYRGQHFSLKNGIKLFGGFIGGETSLEERDLENNKTLLSGDIGEENSLEDNCYNIFFNIDIVETAFIDGFIFSYGNNVYDFEPHNLEVYGLGAALHNDRVNLEISNCIFSNNYGGAVYNKSKPEDDETDTFEMIFDNCFFENNSSPMDPGRTPNTWAAFKNIGNYNTVFNHCRFTDNQSGSTVALSSSHGYSYNKVEIYNSLFSRNHTNYGNCINLSRNDTYGVSAEPIKIINCTFVNNTAVTGWGSLDIYNHSPLVDFAEITNSVFYNNDKEQIWTNEFDTLQINNCAFTQTEFDFGYEGENNIILSSNNAGDPNSPYFSDPERNHWWIQAASPLRNVGVWTTDVPLYDIVGNIRDDYPDIGCYEYDPSSIEDSESLVPITTKLYQNYPNPFNPATNIKFSIAKAGKVELSVYNVLGQVVAKLVEGDLKAGHHSIVFNADAINSGVYYYTLEVDGKSLTKRMLMIK